MSFTSLTKQELVRTAEEDFGVEVNRAHSKKQIIDELKENGVTWQMYLQENPDKAAELKPAVGDNVIRAPEVTEDELYDVPENHRKPKVAQPAVEEDRVLVKMTRANPLYEVRGYRFTKEHPFQLVKIEDSDYILLEEDGFRQATPREVQEYYG